jgi:hypothetical protein
MPAEVGVGQNNAHSCLLQPAGRSQDEPAGDQTVWRSLRSLSPGSPA